MSIDEIIASGLLESYVLGKTSAEETAMIKELCKLHPSLIAEIELIEQSLITLASESVPKPNEALKDKITSDVLSLSPVNEDAKLIELTREHDGKLRLYKVGLAAGLLLFVASFIYGLLIQQKVGELTSELASLRESKDYLTQEVKIQESSINAINQRLRIVTNPGVKSVALKGMNSLANKSAVVYWNANTSEVYFNIDGLPDSPASKQYQLWAIVDGKPVDMGVIDLSAGDSAYQKMKSVSGATAFAVTIEKTGGSPTPSLETMCLLGNV